MDTPSVLPYTWITPLCTHNPLTCAHSRQHTRTQTHACASVLLTAGMGHEGLEVAGNRGPRPPRLPQRPTRTPPGWRSGTKAEAVSATPGVVPSAPCRGRARYRPLGPRAPGQRRALSRLRRKLSCSCKTPEGSFCSHPVAWFGVKSVSHPVFPAAGTATSDTGGEAGGVGQGVGGSGHPGNASPASSGYWRGLREGRRCRHYDLGASLGAGIHHNC